MKYENEIRKIISNHTSENIKIHNCGIDDTISEIGIDSISFVEIIVAIEDYFELFFPLEKMSITECETLKNLCEIVENVLNT